MVACPIAGIAFLLTFVIKVYTLNRASTRLPAGGKPSPVEAAANRQENDETAAPSNADVDVEKGPQDKAATPHPQ